MSELTTLIGSQPTGTISQPAFTGAVNQDFFIEPLGGPKRPSSYLDRFPDAVYLKSPESRLARLLYALLGPAGVGRIRKEYLALRLLLEARGISLFDIEAFYGSPFSFGRIFDEVYEPPTLLLPREEWDLIAARDAQYRNRAFDFVRGARAGNTPFGMRLVARSGLGHDVSIVENYRYLYDQHSDLPLGLPYFGQTLNTNEMVVVPRREVSRTQIQTISFTGTVSGGTWGLTFRGIPGQYNSTPALGSSIDPFDLEAALVALPSIGAGNVVVTGGPATSQPFTIQFANALSAQDLPDLEPYNNLTGTNPKVVVTSSTGILETTDESVGISPQSLHELESALDQIRPVSVFPTVAPGVGLRTRQIWRSVFASGSYNAVIPYVTGTSSVAWPRPDSINWIQSEVEVEAPQVYQANFHSYESFHKFASVMSYTDLAFGEYPSPNLYPALNLDPGATAPALSTLSQFASEHRGRFNPAQQAVFPFFAQFIDDDEVFAASRSEVAYGRLLTFDDVAIDPNTGSPVQFLNGIYPDGYLSLPGVPQIVSGDNNLWSSLERTSGTEYLEIDLGSTKAVNYISFEITRKPIDIAIAFDVLDQTPLRLFTDVTPTPQSTFPDQVVFSSNGSPFTQLEFVFSDVNGDIPFSRYIRLSFNRRSQSGIPFLFDPVNNYQNPWSVDVRNLRIGRVTHTS